MSWKVKWKEDGSCTIYGRVTARNGSGAVANPGEGRWLQQADFTSIDLYVYDVTNDPDTAVSGLDPSSITISNVVLDTPVTATDDWDEDAIGYNYRHDIASTVFPTGGHKYDLILKFVLAGGEVFNESIIGIARPIRSS